jgi:osmotically-inducible protein OsmY
MRKLLTLAGLGAVLTYFFDPQSGARRRAMTRDRVLAFVQKAKHLKAKEKLADPNDASLAHKVETEIFSDPDVPKGQVDVNAEDGVVILRGEVENEKLIQDLEERTRSVQGVKGVENLLHVSGQEAGMHRAH